jgi:flagellar hook assembly protein FlgD
LSQNYPNPFNPVTTIGFTLPEASEASLEIFNVRGQKVKSLFSGLKAAGEHRVQWNGTDSANRPVSSGLYYYRLQTPQGTKLGKCVLLK